MLIVWCIYFTPTRFVTLEEVKNFKSLQSYKYFTAGWVIDHRWKIFNEVCLIVGKVNHSYAMSSAPLNPWIIIKNHGTVVCGHCTCIEQTHVYIENRLFISEFSHFLASQVPLLAHLLEHIMPSTFTIVFSASSI